jgi:hypothetical protein
MNYLQLLQKHGLTEETVSASIKTLIKQAKKLTALVDENEVSLETETSDRKKEKLHEEIAAGREAIASLEERIEKGIDRYVRNKDLYKKNGEILNQKKAAKQAQAAAAAADPAATDKPTATPAATTADPANDPAKVEKKKGFGGWIVGGALLIVGAVVGFNIYQNNK